MTAAVRAIQPAGLRLARAIAIGQELGRIHRDASLHSLSKEAWVRLCGQLGGCRDLAALEALVAKCRRWPSLWSEIQIRAKLWMDGHQDRPAIWSGFGPRGDQASYAERLAAELTIEQCSAVAALVCAEMRDPSTFGALSDWSDLDALTGPRLRELVELDRELAATFRLADAEWDGSAPVIRYDGYVLALGPGSVNRIASDLAEMARLHDAHDPGPDLGDRVPAAG